MATIILEILILWVYTWNIVNIGPELPIPYLLQLIATDVHVSNFIPVI